MPILILFLLYSKCLILFYHMFSSNNYPIMEFQPISLFLPHFLHIPRLLFISKHGGSILSAVTDSGKENCMNSNCIKIMAAAVAIVGLFSAVCVASGGSGERGERRGPPPEAVEACKGKSEGTAVEFTNRGGEIMKGTCRQTEGQLAAMPDNLRGRYGGPPQAQ
jgi:hypothetical protein